MWPYFSCGLPLHIETEVANKTQIKKKEEKKYCVSPRRWHWTRQFQFHSPVAVSSCPCLLLSPSPASCCLLVFTHCSHCKSPRYFPKYPTPAAMAFHFWFAVATFTFANTLQITNLGSYYFLNTPIQNYINEASKFDINLLKYLIEKYMLCTRMYYGKLFSLSS